MKRQMVSLAELAGGGAVELIDAQIVKAIADMVDLNADARAKRIVNVKIEFTPVGDNRDAASVKIEATMKGGNYEGANSTVYFREFGGTIQASEHHPRQETLFKDEPRPAAVQTGEAL